MNAIQLLRNQLKASHELMEGTMKDVTEEVAGFNETGKALPAGAAYAHAVITEDIVITTMLTHATPLSAQTEKTGLSEPMPSFAEWDKHEAWTKTVKIDLTKFRAFAQEVYTATDKYIESLTEADLDQEIEIPGMGKHTKADMLSNFIIEHNASLAGEVSAAKGVQGKKGYPF